MMYRANEGWMAFGEFKKTCSDRDAKSGIKHNGDGEDEKWLGYKMHLVGNAEYELPLMPIITPANANGLPAI
jgi:hypothetical protein